VCYGVGVDTTLLDTMRVSQGVIEGRMGDMSHDTGLDLVA
jgi:hypothetical protein